jgi:NlpC/P60 family
MLVSSSKVVDFAKTFDHSSWVDPSSPGPYCALFVRHVFRQCGANLAVASKPSDWADSRHMAQGAAFANSLAGDEIGPKITSKSMLQPGDLVFWRKTYAEFAHSPVITHVGIYAGNGKVVDRGSSGVHYRSIDTFSDFVEGRRPRCFDAARGADIAGASPHKVSKIELIKGNVSAKVRGAPARVLRLAADSTGAVMINGQRVHASSFLIEMQDQNGHWYKGYLHDKRCNFIRMNKIICDMVMGAVSVEIDTGMGIKPHSIVMTVVEA